MQVRVIIDNRIIGREEEFLCLSEFALQGKGQMLVYGVPGCGKTLVCKRIAMIHRLQYYNCALSKPSFEEFAVYDEVDEVPNWQSQIKRGIAISNKLAAVCRKSVGFQSYSIPTLCRIARRMGYSDDQNRLMHICSKVRAAGGDCRQLKQYIDYPELMNERKEQEPSILMSEVEKAVNKYKNPSKMARKPLYSKIKRDFRANISYSEFIDCFDVLSDMGRLNGV